MRAWGAIAVGALLSACQFDEPWHGDTSFSLEERTAIESGRQWVCQRTGRECEPIVWDRAPGDVRPATIARVVGPIRRDDAHYAGWCDGDAGVIYLYSGMPYMRGVAAHEFGHWLGFQHAPEGFMSDPVQTDDLH